VLLERDFSYCKPRWELMAMKAASYLQKVPFSNSYLLQAVTQLLRGMSLPSHAGEDVEEPNADGKDRKEEGWDDEDGDEEDWEGEKKDGEEKEDDRNEKEDDEKRKEEDNDGKKKEQEGDDEKEDEDQVIDEQQNHPQDKAIGCRDCDYFPEPGLDQRKKLARHRLTAKHRRNSTGGGSSNHNTGGGAEAGAAENPNPAETTTTPGPSLPFPCTIAGCPAAVNREDNMRQHDKNRHGGVVTSG
jgi:hypothetical protein